MTSDVGVLIFMGIRKPVTPYYDFLTVLAVFFLFAHLSGCAHTPMNPDYFGPEPLPAGIEKEYDHIPFKGAYHSETIEECEDYVLWQIRFTPATNIIDMDHDIVLDYYEIRDAEKTPVILVLPIFGGSNYFSNTFAEYFAAHGYSAIIVHRQKRYKTFSDLDKMDGILRQIVLDHKQAIDWIEMQPPLDTDRIGVFGISMGSIKAALIGSLDKRVRATVMCLAGGNLAEIIATSDEKGVVRRREEYLKTHGITSDEFYELLRTKITCDPINYAQYMDAGNALMVLGRFDSAVPYKNGYELWTKIGKPEKITMLTGHYTAVLGLPYVKMKALDFFNRKLK